MSAYDLPTTVDANGQTLHIRNDGDWRMVIDVNIALSDIALNDQERAVAALTIFYDVDGLERIKDPQSAIDGMLRFISAGTESPVKKPKLVDWEDDAQLIVSGINSVLGREVRMESYMHWWTFIAAYMSIGDGALATVVSIRDKIARGKKLEKHEREFKRDNPQYFMNKREQEAAHELLLELIE